MRVLVVEDDAELAETVAAGLRRARMAVDLALDGPAGLERALINGYDVIVLDRDLPGMHGDEVCGRLTAAGCRSRVLMLTAADTTEDLVQGLSLGADDYLPKPFDFPVLVARIGALFRRAQPAIPPVLRHGGLVLDTGRHCAWRGGRPLDLAPKEFGVLEVLLAAAGRAVPAEELLERVWDENADPFTAAVKITVGRLRAKLGDPPLITTVPRSGYRIGGRRDLPRSRRAGTRARWPRRTLRLRLTAWYGGLFLLSGTVLLALTYGLVVQALVGKSAGNALCQGPGAGCHIIGAQQARAIALQQNATVLSELLSRSALALALVAVLSVVLGWFMAGRALGPLRTITTTAREISVSSLSERLALGGPRDELTELADTFDGLMARLEAAFKAQRQFIANAAHELRTPLARQRVISQVALADPDASIQSLRTAHERVLASGTQQHELINALLILARGQAGLDAREPFDLADVAARVMSERQHDVQRRT